MVLMADQAFVHITSWGDVLCHRTQITFLSSWFASDDREISTSPVSVHHNAGVDVDVGSGDGGRFVGG